VTIEMKFALDLVPFVALLKLRKSRVTFRKKAWYTKIHRDLSLTEKEL